MLETYYFDIKIEKKSGEGAQPFPDLTPSGEGDTHSPSSHPSALR